MVDGIDGAYSQQTHWMNKPLLFCLITCLILDGCTLIKTSPERPKLTSDPLAASAHLIQAGQLGEAVALLEEAVAQQGENPEYRVQLNKTRLQKQSHERELQDLLLIEQTSALQKQLPIIVRLVRSDPANQALQGRLEQIHKDLKQNRRALSHCGWFQHSLNPKLASRCLTLALSLETDPQDQRLLDHLQKKQLKAQQAQEQKQQAIRQQVLKSRNQERLQQARKFHQANRLNEARKQLYLVLKEDPKNQQALQLLGVLKNQLEGYLNNLLKAGDRLYREGEVEGAKAIWQAAYNLDPNDSRAREKIERAQRVLENLDTLRKAQ